MRSFRGLGWALVGFVLAVDGASGFGQDAPAGSNLIQVRFDGLVPTSYPVLRPRFDRLRPTTYPVIHPGVAQVAITSNLTNAFAQPLLHPYPYGSVSASSYGATVVSARAKKTPVTHQDRSRPSGDIPRSGPKIPATPPHSRQER